MNTANYEISPAYFALHGYWNNDSSNSVTFISIFDGYQGCLDECDLTNCITFSYNHLNMYCHMTYVDLVERGALYNEDLVQRDYYSTMYIAELGEFDQHFS